MPTGREETFRALFAREAEVRLGRMAEALLELQPGGDDELVVSIFRDAHTIKGSAATVGLDEIARLAHAMEELLELLRSKQLEPDADIVDALLAGVDGVRLLMQAGPPGLVDALLPALQRAALPAPRTDPAADAPDPAAASSEPGGPAAGEAPAAVAPPPGRPALGPAPRHEAITLEASRVDELVRLVGEAVAAQLRLGQAMAERGNDPVLVPEYRELRRSLLDLQERTMRARMVPVASIAEGLHRAVRETARVLGKSVRWEMVGGETELDRSVLDRLSDALLHVVRNAVAHGVELPAERVAAGKPEQGLVRLHAMQLGSEVILVVSDDGAGLDLARVRAAAGAPSAGDEDARYLIFRSGVSTATTVTDVAGRGIGLDAVRASLDAVRGRVDVHSDPGRGAEFRLAVPVSLAVLPCLLVGTAGRRYAVPMRSVLSVLPPVQGERQFAEGRETVWVSGAAVATVPLSQVLEGAGDSTGPALVLAGLTRRHAFRVDELVGRRDVVVTRLPAVLPRLPAVMGASVEPDGSVVLVLDTPGLIDLARHAGMTRTGSAAEAAAPGRRATVLVVDDAMTVRELQRSILERAGYEVVTAGDGAQALTVLGRVSCDLVLTDVEMPVMDGFALTEEIRRRKDFANLAVLILTSRSGDEDRRKGLEAGADGYIVKSSFDEASLLAAVDRLLGR